MLADTERQRLTNRQTKSIPMADEKTIRSMLAGRKTDMAAD